LFPAVILDHRLAEADRARRGYRVMDRVEAVDRAAAEAVATARVAAAARVAIRAATGPATAADMGPEAVAAARVAPAMISATNTRRDE